MADKKFTPPPPVPDDEPASKFIPPPPTPDDGEQPGFLPSLWNTLKQGPGNLLAAGNGINHAIAHPLDTLNSMGEQTARLGKSAGESFRKGDVISGIRKGINTGINAVLPGLGAQSEDAGQEFDKGNYASGAGKTLGVGVNTALGITSPKIAGLGAKAVYNTPRALGAVGTGLKAAAPDLATGGAMIGGGELLSKVPGMEWPARIALDYPGARQVARGLRQGATATRAAFNGAEAPSPAPLSSRPVAGLPNPTGDPPVRIIQHLGDMRINGRTPPPPKLFDAYGREMPPQIQ